MVDFSVLQRFGWLYLIFKVLYYIFPLQVRLKCVKTLKSLFTLEDRSIATPYIHMLAPQLVEYLYSETSKKIHTEAELLVNVETINTLEALIDLAESKDRK